MLRISSTNFASGNFLCTFCRRWRREGRKFQVMAFSPDLELRYITSCQNTIKWSINRFPYLTGSRHSSSNAKYLDQRYFKGKNIRESTYQDKSEFSIGNQARSNKAVSLLNCNVSLEQKNQQRRETSFLELNKKQIHSCESSSPTSLIHKRNMPKRTICKNIKTTHVSKVFLMSDLNRRSLKTIQQSKNLVLQQHGSCEKIVAGEKGMKIKSDYKLWDSTDSWEKLKPFTARKIKAKEVVCSEDIKIIGGLCKPIRLSVANGKKSDNLWCASKETEQSTENANEAFVQFQELLQAPPSRDLEQYLHEQDVRRTMKFKTKGIRRKTVNVFKASDPFVKQRLMRNKANLNVYNQIHLLREQEPQCDFAEVQCGRKKLYIAFMDDPKTERIVDKIRSRIATRGPWKMIPNKLIHVTVEKPIRNIHSNTVKKTSGKALKLIEGKAPEKKLPPSKPQPGNLLKDNSEKPLANATPMKRLPEESPRNSYEPPVRLAKKSRDSKIVVNLQKSCKEKVGSPTLVIQEKTSNGLVKNTRNFRVKTIERYWLTTRAGKIKIQYLTGVLKNITNKVKDIEAPKMLKHSIPVTDQGNMLLHQKADEKMLFKNSEKFKGRMSGPFVRKFKVMKSKEGDQRAANDKTNKARKYLLKILRRKVQPEKKSEDSHIGIDTTIAENYSNFDKLMRKEAKPLPEPIKVPNIPNIPNTPAAVESSMKKSPQLKSPFEYKRAETLQEAKPNARLPAEYTDLQPTVRTPPSKPEQDLQHVNQELPRLPSSSIIDPFFMQLHQKKLQQQQEMNNRVTQQDRNQQVEVEQGIQAEQQIAKGQQVKAELQTLSTTQVLSDDQQANANHLEGAEAHKQNHEGRPMAAEAADDSKTPPQSSTPGKSNPKSDFYYPEVEKPKSRSGKSAQKMENENTPKSTINQFMSSLRRPEEQFLPFSVPVPTFMDANRINKEIQFYDTGNQLEESINEHVRDEYDPKVKRMIKDDLPKFFPETVVTRWDGEIPGTWHTVKDYRVLETNRPREANFRELVRANACNNGHDVTHSFMVETNTFDEYYPPSDEVAREDSIREEFSRFRYDGEAEMRMFESAVARNFLGADNLKASHVHEFESIPEELKNADGVISHKIHPHFNAQSTEEVLKENMSHEGYRAYATSRLLPEEYYETERSTYRTKDVLIDHDKSFSNPNDFSPTENYSFTDNTSTGRVDSFTRAQELPSNERNRLSETYSTSNSVTEENYLPSSNETYKPVNYQDKESVSSVNDSPHENIVGLKPEVFPKRDDTQLPFHGETILNHTVTYFEPSSNFQSVAVMSIQPREKKSDFQSQDILNEYTDALPSSESAFCKLDTTVQSTDSGNFSALGKEYQPSEMRDGNNTETLQMLSQIKTQAKSDINSQPAEIHSSQDTRDVPVGSKTSLDSHFEIQLPESPACISEESRNGVSTAFRAKESRDFSVLGILATENDSLRSYCAEMETKNTSNAGDNTPKNVVQTGINDDGNVLETKTIVDSSKISSLVTSGNSNINLNVPLSDVYVPKDSSPAHASTERTLLAIASEAAIQMTNATLAEISKSKNKLTKNEGVSYPRDVVQETKRHAVNLSENEIYPNRSVREIPAKDVPLVNGINHNNNYDGLRTFPLLPTSVTAGSNNHTKVSSMGDFNSADESHPRKSEQSERKSNLIIADRLLPKLTSTTVDNGSLMFRNILSHAVKNYASGNKAQMSSDDNSGKTKDSPLSGKIITNNLKSESKKSNKTESDQSKSSISSVKDIDSKMSIQEKSGQTLLSYNTTQFDESNNGQQKEKNELGKMEKSYLTEQESVEMSQDNKEHVEAGKTDLKPQVETALAVHAHGDKQAFKKSSTREPKELVKKLKEKLAEKLKHEWKVQLFDELKDNVKPVVQQKLAPNENVQDQIVLEKTTFEIEEKMNPITASKNEFQAVGKQKEHSEPSHPSDVGRIEVSVKSSSSHFQKNKLEKTVMQKEKRTDTSTGEIHPGTIVRGQTSSDDFEFPVVNDNKPEKKIATTQSGAYPYRPDIDKFGKPDDNHPYRTKETEKPLIPDYTRRQNVTPIKTFPLRPEEKFNKPNEVHPYRSDASSPTKRDNAHPYRINPEKFKKPEELKPETYIKPEILYPFFDEEQKSTDSVPSQPPPRESTPREPPPGEREKPKIQPDKYHPYRIDPEKFKTTYIPQNESEKSDTTHPYRIDPAKFKSDDPYPEQPEKHVSVPDKTHPYRINPEKFKQTERPNPDVDHSTKPEDPKQQSPKSYLENEPTVSAEQNKNIDEEQKESHWKQNEPSHSEVISARHWTESKKAAEAKTEEKRKQERIEQGYIQGRQRYFKTFLPDSKLQAKFMKYEEVNAASTDMPMKDWRYHQKEEYLENAANTPAYQQPTDTPAEEKFSAEHVWRKPEEKKFLEDDGKKVKNPETVKKVTNQIQLQKKNQDNVEFTKDEGKKEARKEQSSDSENRTEMKDRRKSDMDSRDAAGSENKIKSGNASERGVSDSKPLEKIARSEQPKKKYDSRSSETSKGHRISGYGVAVPAGTPIVEDIEIKKEVITGPIVYIPPDKTDKTHKDPKEKPPEKEKAIKLPGTGESTDKKIRVSEKGNTKFDDRIDRTELIDYGRTKTKSQIEYVAHREVKPKVDKIETEIINKKKDKRSRETSQMKDEKQDIDKKKLAAKPKDVEDSTKQESDSDVRKSMSISISPKTRKAKDATEEKPSKSSSGLSDKEKEKSEPLVREKPMSNVEKLKNFLDGKPLKSSTDFTESEKKVKVEDSNIDKVRKKDAADSANKKKDDKKAVTKEQPDKSVKPAEDSKDKLKKEDAKDTKSDISKVSTSKTDDKLTKAKQTDSKSEKKEQSDAKNETLKEKTLDKDRKAEVETRKSKEKLGKDVEADILRLDKKVLPDEDKPAEQSSENKSKSETKIDKKEIVSKEKKVSSQSSENQVKDELKTSDKKFVAGDVIKSVDDKDKPVSSKKSPDKNPDPSKTASSGTKKGSTMSVGEGMYGMAEGTGPDLKTSGTQDESNEVLETLNDECQVRPRIGETGDGANSGNSSPTMTYVSSYGDHNRHQLQQAYLDDYDRCDLGDFVTAGIKTDQSSLFQDEDEAISILKQNESINKTDASDRKTDAVENRAVPQTQPPQSPPVVIPRDDEISKGSDQNPNSNVHVVKIVIMNNNKDNDIVIEQENEPIRKKEDNKSEAESESGMRRVMNNDRWENELRMWTDALKKVLLKIANEENPKMSLVQAGKPNINLPERVNQPTDNDHIHEDDIFAREMDDYLQNIAARPEPNPYMRLFKNLQIPNKSPVVWEEKGPEINLQWLAELSKRASFNAEEQIRSKENPSVTKTEGDRLSVNNVEASATRKRSPDSKSQAEKTVKDKKDEGKQTEQSKHIKRPPNPVGAEGAIYGEISNYRPNPYVTSVQNEETRRGSTNNRNLSDAIKNMDFSSPNSFLQLFRKTIDATESEIKQNSVTRQNTLSSVDKQNDAKKELHVFLNVLKRAIQEVEKENSKLPSDPNSTSSSGGSAKGSPPSGKLVQSHADTEKGRKESAKGSEYPANPYDLSEQFTRKTTFETITGDAKGILRNPKRHLYRDCSDNVTKTMAVTGDEAEFTEDDVPDTKKLEGLQKFSERKPTKNKENDTSENKDILVSSEILPFFERDLARDGMGAAVEPFSVEGDIPFTKPSREQRTLQPRSEQQILMKNSDVDEEARQDVREFLVKSTKPKRQEFQSVTPELETEARDIRVDQEPPENTVRQREQLHDNALKIGNSNDNMDTKKDVATVKERLRLSPSALSQDQREFENVERNIRAVKDGIDYDNRSQVPRTILPDGTNPGGIRPEDAPIIKQEEDIPITLSQQEFKTSRKMTRTTMQVVEEQEALREPPLQPPKKEVSKVQQLQQAVTEESSDVEEVRFAHRKADQRGLPNAPDMNSTGTSQKRYLRTLATVMRQSDIDTLKMEKRESVIRKMTRNSEVRPPDSAVSESVRHRVIPRMFRRAEFPLSEKELSHLRDKTDFRPVRVVENPEEYANLGGSDEFSDISEAELASHRLKLQSLAKKASEVPCAVAIDPEGTPDLMQYSEEQETVGEDDDQPKLDPKKYKQKKSENKKML